MKKVLFPILALILALVTPVLAARPVQYDGSTAITFSAEPAILSGDSDPDVTITTTTTAAPTDVIDAGKVTIQLAVDEFGDPVSAGSVSVSDWVSLNPSGDNPTGGVFSLPVDLEDWGFVPGTVGGFRAHYVGSWYYDEDDRYKVKNHFSPEVDLMAIASSGSISGAKFYDANTDGVWDVDELAIEGWKVELYDGEDTLLDTQFTDEDGEYTFADLDAGTYTVKEVMPPGETTFNSVTYPKWLNTTDNSITVEDLSGPSVDNNFGNVCIGYDGGGHSKGFWGNSNGEEKIGEMGLEDTLAYLRDDLHLRNADGSDFDPEDYDGFEAWLQSANAVNMAYMLSAQLAAMELNVLAEFVDDSSLVYAPGTTSANSAGFASIRDLRTEANAEIGTYSTAFDGDDWRAYQEALKNALDAANNNVNFVCPEFCPFTYE